MNNGQLLGAIFTSPGAALQELRERPRSLLPLLLVLFGTVAGLVWYYGIVDIDWLREHIVDSNANMRNMPAAQREKAMAGMTRPIMLVSSAVGAIIVILLIRTVEAGYYSLAGKITNVQYSFRHWFALSCWTSMPHLLGVLVTMGYLLLAPTNQLSNEEVQLLSLNELFFHRTAGQPGFMLLSSITILSPWAWALTVLGIKIWSSRSWLFSVLFGLLPAILIYGGWALFAFKPAA